MIIDVIIGHKNSHPTRARNLDFVLKYYRKHLPYSKIIVVEQGTSTDYIDADDHIIIDDIGGLYGRSLGFNEGFKESKADAFIFTDNDCVPHPSVLESIYRDFKNYDMIIPYKAVVDLEDSETSLLISGVDPKIKRYREFRGRPIVNHGGTTFVTREGFVRVGGFDPQFIGWGGEDYSFFGKCDTLLNWKRSNKDMYHMYHDREYKRAANPEAEKNRLEAHRIADMGRVKLREYIKSIGRAHFEK
jgi:hypothetical protein